MKRVPTTYIRDRGSDCEAFEGSGVSLVYLLYDNNFNLVPSGSGALRVENPNQLESLITDEISVTKDGFMHMGACPERSVSHSAEGVAWVSNGSANKGLYFDNSCGERSRTILVTMMDGGTRQINHYYPYGLRIAGLDGYSHDYKNMYTGKELQTEEFQPFISTGLEMYDFHARFYDPQLGRWFTPDPAEQFSNPYLAMGNNPVMYVDPDGEFVFAAVGIGILANALITGAVIGAASYTASVALSPGGFDNWNGGQFAKSIGIGAVSGVLTAGIGSAFGAVGGTGSAMGNIAKEVTRAGFHGMSSVTVNAAFGNDVSAGTFAMGTFSSLSGSLTSNWSAGAQIGLSSATGGLTAKFTGGDFWAGAANGAIVGSLNHAMHGVTKRANLRYIQNKGTEFGSRQELVAGMLADQSKEYAGADFTDKSGNERYFMLDASSNSSTHGLFDPRMLPKYVGINRRYHTHTTLNPPGQIDSMNAAKNGGKTPSYVITQRLSYLVKPYPAAPIGVDYYSRTYQTSDWLNGNFSGLK